MSYIRNLGLAVFNITDKQHSSNVLFGENKKYNPDQNDKNYAFEEAFAKSSDVYSVVGKIARTAKTIPWIVYKKTGDNIEEVTSGELFDIVNKPNDTQSREVFTELGLIQLLLSGNVYFMPIEAVGFANRAAEVNLLHPQLMHIKNKYIGYFNTVEKYLYYVGGKQFKILPDELTHLKYANPTMYGIDRLEGLSPLVAGYLTANGLISNQTASTSILDNQGASGILSNESDVVLTPTEQKTQQELFDKKAAGATKFGKIIQAMSKVKFTRLGLDPTQLKVIESKVMKMRDLCNIYDIPSQLFNDPTNRIQSNMTPAGVMFISNAVIPQLKTFLSGYEKCIVEPFNKLEFPTCRSKYYIDLDISNIPELQKDENKKAEKSLKLTTSIVKVLASEISDGQKIQTLIHAHDMNEEQARVIVNSK